MLPSMTDEEIRGALRQAADQVAKELVEKIYDAATLALMVLRTESGKQIADIARARAEFDGAIERERQAASLNGLGGVH